MAAKILIAMNVCKLYSNLSLPPKVQDAGSPKPQ